MRAVTTSLLITAALLLAGCPLGGQSESSDAVEKPSPKTAVSGQPSTATTEAVQDLEQDAESACDCVNEVPDAVAVAEIPVKFRGDWSHKCPKPGEYDDSGLTISKNTIAYIEGMGSIKAVVLRGNNELAIIAEMRGEGEQWLSYRRFEVSEDAEELMEVTNDEDYFMRRRCKGVG